MTPLEFIDQSVGFVPGKFYVVSGPDSMSTWALLEAAKTKIESETANIVFVYETDEEILYTERNYSVNTTEARLFEYIKIAAESNFVFLISHIFDINDKSQNPLPVSMTVDVVMNLIQPNRNIIRSVSDIYPEVRELYPLIDRIYYYDTPSLQIHYIKDRQAIRPP